MNYLLVATSALHPYLNKMIAKTSHQVRLVDSAQDVQALIDGTTDVDAVILADGEEAVSEQGLTAKDIPLIIPRVHNAAALLLGGSDAYRSVFAVYQPGICFLFPQMEQPAYFSAQQECDCICYFADTAYGCEDTSLAARSVAQTHGYDYIEREIDPRLCQALLDGSVQSHPDIVVVGPGEQAKLTYRHSLIEAE